MNMSRSATQSGAVRAAEPVPVGQSWDVQLEHYRQRARRTLRAHRRLEQQSHCLSCGQVWPCRPSLAAAFVLEL